MGDLKLAAFCVQHAAFMNDNLNKKNHRSNTLTDQKMPAQGRLLSSRNTNSKMAGGVGPSLSRFSRMTTQSNQSNSSNINHSVTQQALVYLFLKNYKKAVDILERELRIKPSTEIFNLLGRVNMKSKSWEAAVDAFEKSISLNVIFIS
jgi:tetratricopeptide (TPR) repeat protein